MKKGTFGTLLVTLALLSMLTFQECFAGVVIRQVMKDREGMTSAVVLYYSGEQLRTDNTGSGLTTIMDFKDDRMIMIDHRSKQYVDTKFSQWEKEMMDRIKKEAQGIQSKARKITVRKTGETATLNGFRTEKIQILAGGELIEEDWVTRDVDMTEIEKTMDRAVQGYSKEFGVAMQEGREIYQKIKPYGFPVFVKDYSLAQGLAIDVLEVKQWERKELGKEIFAPPSGYERILLEPSKK